MASLIDHYMVYCIRKLNGAVEKVHDKNSVHETF